MTARAESKILQVSLTDPTSATLGLRSFCHGIAPPGHGIATVDCKFGHTWRSRPPEAGGSAW